MKRILVWLVLSALIGVTPLLACSTPLAVNPSLAADGAEEVSLAVDGGGDVGVSCVAHAVTGDPRWAPPRPWFQQACARWAWEVQRALDPADDHFSPSLNDGA